MRRLLAMLIAVTVLIVPMGAAAHALQRDRLASSDTGPIWTLAVSAAADVDCRSAMHRVTTNCHLEPAVVRGWNGQPGRCAPSKLAVGRQPTPPGFEPQGLLDPPRFV